MMDGGLRVPDSRLMDSSNGSRDGNPLTDGILESTPYAALAQALDDVVADRYHVGLTLLQYPSQGDFAWWYRNDNQDFNQWTLDYLSARVLPGDAPGLAQLSSPGGLTEMGARLLGSLTYRLSAEDQRSADPALLALRDRQLAEIGRMMAPGAAPSAANGGMRTVDPTTGALSACQPAYAVSASLPALQIALSGGGDSIEVTVPGQGGEQVTFTYPNCVLVGCGPLAWQGATGKGWWVDEPIGEAFANRGRDVTGFAFVAPPPFRPGPISAGGTAGRLSGLLLSNPPTLQIHGASSTASSFPTLSPDIDPEVPFQPTGVTGEAAAALSPAAREVLAPFALLGLGVEGAVTFSETHSAPLNVRQPLGPEPATIHLTPVAGPTVPLLQQTAYVVGAVVDTW